MSKEQDGFRCGIGYDTHRLVEGRKLFLGGVAIASPRGLLGHSDGDVLSHAIADALLGAAGMGDIGQLFPDTDPANKGRNSMEMLSLAVDRIERKGFSVASVDITVVAEKPRIGPYRAEMRDAIARALHVSSGAVSVKGKTNEGMGWIGRGEGLACIAIATLAESTR